MVFLIRYSLLNPLSVLFPCRVVVGRIHRAQFGEWVAAFPREAAERMHVRYGKGPVRERDVSDPPLKEWACTSKSSSLR